MALTISETIDLDQQILLQFKKIQLPVYKMILSYMPILKKKEPNIELFLSFLKQKFSLKQFAFPVVDGLNMRAFLSDEKTSFAPNRWGIVEPVDGLFLLPEQLDLIMVPLLICDQKGYRVGYGKGYYDRYLSQVSPACLKVGFSYFEPIDQIDDLQDFDVPLDYVITPDRVYCFVEK